jgi:hypothetical protein
MGVVERIVIAWESHPVLCIDRVVVLLRTTTSLGSAGAHHFFKKPQLHTYLDMPRESMEHILVCLDTRMYSDAPGPDRSGRSSGAVAFGGDFVELVKSLANQTQVVVFAVHIASVVGP